MATLAFPPTASSFPSASTSNPGSPTFPHSQSLSLNGAGFALALRPGTSVGNRPLDIGRPSAALPDEPPTANGRTYLAFIKSWDDDHVGRWLYEVHVGQYADVFRTNDIRGDVLLDVDQQALKEMGVRSVGDRVKIMVAIKALRQRCVKATVSIPPRLSSYGSMASLASNGTSSSSAGAAVGRKPSSGKGAGRIPPPLHLSQSNTSPPRAWQPSTTPGSSRPNLSINSSLLNAPTPGITTASSPRSPSRNIPPPSLPPPRSRPPPAPNARNSPPTTQSSLPCFGAPSISTTAASPTSSSFPANTSSSNTSGGTWSGSSGTSPAPSVERKLGSPQHPPTGVVPPRPSTGAHRKTGSTGASPGRPSTTPGNAYGHNQPLSTHPYATSTSPTSDGFSNTIYGRPIPASLPTKSPLTLLPSPPIANVPGTDVYLTARTRPSTPGGMSSLDAVMRKAVKFMCDDGVSKMIAVADCTTGKEVLVRVLRKFQVLGAGAGAGAGSGSVGEGDEGEGWGVYATNDGQVQRMLSETELFAVCRDGQAPERQRGLTLRRIRDFEATKRGRKLQWMFGVPSPPDSTRPGGVSTTSPTSPNYLGVGIPSTTIEPASPSPSTSSDFERAQSVTSGDRRMKRASTISIMSSLGVEPAQAPTHSPSSASFLSSGRKLRNFFGQRPPSELIATHLTEYFPKAEKNKLLSKQVRESMRKSIVRRDSQYSVVDTSWEKAPDRYSLNPATQSRFSGSSGGSIRSSVQQASAVADRDYPTTPPRFGGARSLADNQSIRSSAPPSILEPPDESAEDDDGADTRSIAKSVASKSSRRSKSSRMSGWDGRSKDSDSASMITVDEVTAELETRRKSLASYMSGDDNEEELPIEEDEPGEVRPPSIEFSLEEEAGEEDESEEDESGSEEDESEEEVPALAVSTSKPALKWIKGALIGAGSFGSVYLGMNPTSGSLMAVKQVELPTGNSHNEERKKSMLDALEREIELLKVLQHENIVQYLDSSSDATHLNIFLEYVPGGSVAALLSNYGAFEEALVSKFVRQILTGLEYLHEREIIHRDIKGANILVDNNGGIKISDFGISKKVEDNLLSGSKVHRPSLQGSVYWMAPEVVKQTAYTSKADIWSLGCLVVEMLTGVHPWANLTQMQAIFRIGSSATPTIPDDISNDAEDFLDQTFLIDYKERPPARELLQHAFIKEVDACTAEQQTPTRATFSQQNSPVKAEVAA